MRGELNDSVINYHNCISKGPSSCSMVLRYTVSTTCELHSHLRAHSQDCHMNVHVNYTRMIFHAMLRATSYKGKKGIFISFIIFHKVHQTTAPFFTLSIFFTTPRAFLSGHPQHAYFWPPRIVLPLIYFYQLQSEWDNALCSICLFVCLHSASWMVWPKTFIFCMEVDLGLG